MCVIYNKNNTLMCVLLKLINLVYLCNFIYECYTCISFIIHEKKMYIFVIRTFKLIVKKFIIKILKIYLIPIMYMMKKWRKSLNETKKLGIDAVVKHHYNNFLLLTICYNIFIVIIDVMYNFIIYICVVIIYTKINNNNE